MRRIFIGDIHGMFKELLNLFREVDYSKSTDEVILVGDLVDKGPESAEVVTYLRHLSHDGGRVVLVEGNHENRHRLFRKRLMEGKVEEALQMKGSEEMANITAKLSREDIRFLDAALPFYKADPFLVVHAGIPASKTALPTKRKDCYSLMHTRHLSSVTGKRVMPENRKPGDPFWASVYDGRFGHVIFGHTPFSKGPAMFTHATCIDTGAVAGWGLTALVTEEDTSGTFVTVPSRRITSYYQDQE